MLNKKELRVGNLLDLYGTVSTLHISDFHYDFTTEKRKLNRFKGLKLNENWIKRADFNFIKLGLSDLSVSFGLVSKEVHFVLGTYYKKLDYVHELQNLYFDLTKKELIFKV